MPLTASDSSWSNPEVERNLFSKSSASVTGSTSMELERTWSACEAEDWSPEEDVPLSLTRTEGSQSGKKALVKNFGKKWEAVMVVVVTGNRQLDSASRRLQEEKREKGERERGESGGGGDGWERFCKEREEKKAR
ncbi:hypothetical protein ACFX1S_026931 [Malus domestica]